MSDTRRILLASLFRAMTVAAKLPASQIAAHLPTLYALAGRCPGGDTVELGVYGGASTVALFTGAVLAGGRLTSYDIDAGYRAQALETIGLKADDAALGAWKFVAKDSLSAAADWADGSVALWFLDTVHSLDMTRSELEAWLPKMRADGVMCGHDYYLEHCVDGQFSVRRAVDEFASRHADRFRLQVMEHDCGLFVLWPK